VQIGLLHDEDFVRAVNDARVAVALVHAVNPFGFSHGRRVNEDNVDLNRNFRDFNLPPPANPAYAELHALLIPPTWPPTPEHEAKNAAYVAAHGVRAYQTAVTGGQYAFPMVSSTAVRRPPGATARFALRCAVTPPAASGSAGSTCTPASDRAATARRYSPAATMRRSSLAPAHGGARGDVDL
jgi:hypothetical protein